MYEGKIGSRQYTVQAAWDYMCITDDWCWDIDKGQMYSQSFGRNRILPEMTGNIFVSLRKKQFSVQC